MAKVTFRLKTADFQSTQTRLLTFLMLSVCSCSPMQPGPDRQAEGTATGAVAGAGAGAVTGFQVGAATGPGAAIGAGFGAVAGAVQGALLDSEEDDLMKLSAEAREERERAHVHQILQDHYQRRLELHPSRDIYPADMFFTGDEIRLCRSGVALVKELARLNLDRMPWSRLVIAVYSKSKNPDSDFARYLSEERTRALADQLSINGINPRRLETRPMIVDAPVLIDALDDPERYSQAVELILIDK